MRTDIEYINYEQEKQAREKRLVAYAACGICGGNTEDRSRTVI